MLRNLRELKEIDTTSDWISQPNTQSERGGNVPEYPQNMSFLINTY